MAGEKTLNESQDLASSPASPSPAEAKESKSIGRSLQAITFAFTFALMMYLTFFVYLPDPAFQNPVELYAGIMRFLFFCGFPCLGVILYSIGNIHKILRAGPKSVTGDEEPEVNPETTPGGLRVG